MTKQSFFGNIELPARGKEDENLKRIALLLLCVCAMIAMSGCGKQSKTAKATGNSAGQPPGKPADFFPSETGCQWRYKITVTGCDQDPLNFRETVWPNSSEEASGRLIVQRGRYMKDEKTDECYLEFRVKGPAEKQGPFEYPLGVELEIIQDDLGIFEWANHVYWAINDSNRFMAELVQTFPSDSPGSLSGGSWGSWAPDGWSTRPFFFGEKPGIGIGFGEDPTERLYFMESIGDDILLFARNVEESKPDPGDPDQTDIAGLRKGFTEIYQFQRDVGLISLEQKVDGKTTMKWELDKYTPGSE